MDFKNLSLGITAITAAYLIMMLPMAGATEVNIIFNGQPQATLDISPTQLIYTSLSIVHNPSDITWTNVKVKVGVNLADPGKSVEKMYLYRCRGSDPV